jgi:hypothetical protein
MLLKLGFKIDDTTVLLFFKGKQFMGNKSSSNQLIAFLN